MFAVVVVIESISHWAAGAEQDSHCDDAKNSKAAEQENPVVLNKPQHDCNCINEPTAGILLVPQPFLGAIKDVIAENVEDEVAAALQELNSDLVPLSAA